MRLFLENVMKLLSNKALNLTFIRLILVAVLLTIGFQANAQQGSLFIGKNGIELTHISTSPNARECENLAANESGLTASRVALLSYEENLAENTMNLDQNNADLVMAQAALLEVQESLARNEEKLNLFNDEYDLLDEEKDRARLVYRTCKRNFGSHACRIENQYYQDAKSALRDFKDDELHPQVNLVNDIQFRLDQQQTIVSDIQREIVLLDAFMVRYDELTLDYNTHVTDYLSALAEVGAYIDFDLYHDFGRSAQDSDMVLSAELFISAPFDNRYGVGQPTGILGYEGNSIFVQNQRDYSANFLWPIYEQPLDKTQAIKLNLSTVSTHTVKIDKHLACAQNGNPDVSRYFDGADIAIVYNVIDEVYVDTPIMVDVNAVMVINYLFEKSNLNGFLTLDNMMDLMESDIPGLYLTLGDVSNSERDEIVRRVKEDLLFNILKISATLAPKQKNQSCNKAEYICRVAGWWLNIEHSPYFDNHAFEAFNNAYNSTFHYRVEGNVYLQKSHAYLVDPDFERSILCSEGEAFINGVCQIPVIECPEGEAFINGVCQIPAIECPEGETLIGGTCQVPVLECSENEVLVDGMCVDILCHAFGVCL